MRSILERAPRVLMMTAVCLAVAACGGAGEEEDEPDWGGGNGSGGSSTGEVARITYGSVPNYNASTSNVQIVAATNRGVYLTDDNSQGGTRVHRMQGVPTATGAWSSADLGAVSPYTVVPSNRYSEADGAISFYYAAASVVGQYNANNGGVSRQWTNDRYIRTIEPGQLQGTFVGPWGLGGSLNSDYNYVYHDDNMYTGSGAVSNKFTTPIGPSPTVNSNQAYFAIQGLLARPDSPELFVATGARSGGGVSELRVYSGSTMTRESLPGGTSVSVSNLQWSGGKLWLRIGDGVYRRDGPGSFVRVAQVSLAFGAIGSFCLKGGEVIGSDGYATRISDGTRRNYLSRGNLSASQQIQIAQVQGSLMGAGVYCSPDNSAAVVYTVGDLATHPGTVAMIEILQ